MEKGTPETKESSSADPDVAEPTLISYPLKVVYCGNCGLPPEYCEYFPDFDNCRTWLEKYLPDELGNLKLGDACGSEEKSGRQKRGGKGLVHGKKTSKPLQKKIGVFRAPRGRKKSVTVVTGLTSCGVDLKVASKFFAQKFSCGSSVTGEDEIVIQGDVKEDLFDIMPEKWPEIPESCITDLGDQKR